MLRKFLTPVLAIVVMTCATDSDAATRTWVGGNDPWDGDIFNWSGTDEPDPDDDAVFNTNNVVDMAMDNEIQSLDLSGDIMLNTETWLLDVNGEVTLSGSGTILRAGRNDLVGLPATSLSAHTITVNSDASFQNANFTSYLDPAGVGVFEINSDGTLYGNGTIRNGDGLASPTVVFENDGVIRPGNVSEGLIVIGTPPPARTLTLSAIDGEARIDLDGLGGNGRLDIQHNQTLDIDIELEDPFDGTIDMTHNATLDIEDAWIFSGTMNIDNGFVPGQPFPFFVPDIPADIAYLQGGSITMNGSATTMNVVDSDGTLQFDSQLTANDGTIDNNGLIVFNQNVTINSGVDFNMIGVNAGMTVGPGATVTINDADMDFDGSGASTNVITVEEGGVLDFNLDSFEGNDRADGFLTVNGGTLSLTVTDNSWTMERRLTLHNNGSVPILSGSAVVIGDDAGFNGLPDADVRVTGNGPAQINSPVTWNSDAEVDVDPGATLAVLGFSTFNTVNGAESAQFDGGGNIYFSGGQVNEETVLNFSGGTVGIDGGGAPVILLSAPDFTLNAPLTINAAQLDEYGRSIVFPIANASELNINSNVGGRLDVNLDNPNDTWTVNQVGIMHVEGGAGFETFLTGNRLNMNGTMNVDGSSRSTAPITFGSTGVVNMNDAAVSLRLNGGSLVDTNRIEGGTINGPGEISATSGRALHGHGTINASIDFDGDTSELLADDGTLNLNGAIQDVGLLGTADSGGVLNVTNAWTTSDTSQVRLFGGQLTGATVTNDGVGGINGQGLVASRLINETIVTADGGGTLVLNTPLNNNNWDGVGNSGTLHASGGSTLELHDSATFLFQGNVEANNATVRTIGYELEFEPGSDLILTNGGRYRSSQATDIGGNVQVNAGAPSTIQIAGSLTFENTSATHLNGDLELNANTIIDAGATFAGGGSLQNIAGSSLTLRDGADVDVLIENSGTLALGSSPGQTTGFDFQQNANGVWDLELGGLGLSDFDRMTLTGAASLDGMLDLSLINGYVPALGDTLNFLSAAGGIAGAFDSIMQPAGMPADLMFDINNLGTFLQLEVVDIPTFTADFDSDGDVDGDDLSQWEGDYALNGDSDAHGDGESSGIDFLTWQQQNGSGVPLFDVFPLSATTSVPEPATMLLVGVAVCWVAVRPQKS